MGFHLLTIYASPSRDESETTYGGEAHQPIKLAAAVSYIPLGEIDTVP